MATFKDGKIAKEIRAALGLRREGVYRIAYGPSGYRQMVGDTAAQYARRHAKRLGLRVAVKHCAGTILIVVRGD